MDSISNQLQTLREIKDGLRQQINLKGGDIDVNTPFTEYPEAVSELSGGGTLVVKNINENGNYTAHDDNADGYSMVKVLVPSVVEKPLYANPRLVDNAARTCYEYVDSILYSSNPIMTADFQDYWIAEASSVGSSMYAYKAFNKSRANDDAWQSESAACWISLTFPAPQRLKSLVIQNEYYTPYNFKNAIIQGREYGSLEWEDLYTITDRPNTAGYLEEYLISDNRKFMAVRLNITASWSNKVSIQNIDVMFENAFEAPKELTTYGYMVGLLTETLDGILYGFSNNAKYMVLSQPFSPGSSSWEVGLDFITGSNVNTQQTIFASMAGTSGVYSGIAVLIKSNRFNLQCSTNGTSYDVNINSSSTISTGTHYRLKAEYTGSEYNLYVSVDNGATYTLEGTASISAPAVDTLVTRIGVYANATDQNFLGRVNLMNSYIYINGSIWWRGALKVNVPLQAYKLNSSFIQNQGNYNKYGGTYIGGSNSYINTNIIPDLTNASTWEFQTKYTYNTGGTANPHIFGYAGGGNYQAPLLLFHPNKKLYMVASSNGTSWDIVSGDSSLTAEAGVTYFIKWGFTGSEYYIDYNTTGWNDSFTRVYSYSSTTKSYCNKPSALMDGTENPSQDWSMGPMYLPETKFYVDGDLMWQAAVPV